jgi:hypothetical protein
LGLFAGSRRWVPLWRRTEPWAVSVPQFAFPNFPFLRPAIPLSHIPLTSRRPIGRSLFPLFAPVHDPIRNSQFSFSNSHFLPRSLGPSPVLIPLHRPGPCLLVATNTASTVKPAFCPLHFVFLGNNRFFIPMLEWTRCETLRSSSTTAARPLLRVAQPRSATGPIEPPNRTSQDRD